MTRFDFATCDVGVAHEMLGQIYEGYRFRGRPAERPFSFRTESVHAGPIAVARAQYTMDVTVRFRPSDSLIFVALDAGRLETHDGPDSQLSLPGDVLVHRTGRPQTNLCSNIDLYGLTLDPRLVADVAATRTGVSRADFRFDAMTPASAELGRFWRDTMAYVHGLLTTAGALTESPLAISAAADLAASVALVAFPNSAMAAPHRPATGPLPPASVRRATAFLEAHLAEPITAVSIAEAARVSPRALQAAFRRHLDTTPMAYLRRARLDRAHQDLLAADPTEGDTVAAIAHRWGYLSLSQFAADYRTAYGRSPRETLRL
ncbi:AraC family transcriptional regulator [Actinoplanes sp. LDG1-06]|uniref:AraC family transcriptional regulator n=1 Tax=Paractinoplanes ovalisporus TaxID=2810368 RepID=A0ABS2AIS8_9ACTN|nr:AraC family transcriptional regulator [Actinoplanes ovalisporus]MBM2619740.1 AraC family transcriptional regulator [Actinoplanes ovalisporus]